jgi:hypothetical protein
MKANTAMAYKHLDDPLVNALYTHRSMFEDIAEVWLGAGACAFGVWNDCLLACWPESAWNELNATESSRDILWAPIKIDG